MCVLIFSTTFVWNISHSEKNGAIYYKKCTQIFMWRTRYSCQILMKDEVSRKIFLKIIKHKIWWIPAQCSRAIPCQPTSRRTDRHEEANSHFSQFCERCCKYNTSILFCFSRYLSLQYLLRGSVRQYVCTAYNVVNRRTLEKPANIPQVAPDSHQPSPALKQ